MQSVSCEQSRAAIGQNGALTAEEWMHLEGCETCLDAWLSRGLETQPEVRIPQDFAARVAAELPETRIATRGLRDHQGAHTPNHDQIYDRHWGLIAAIALVVVGLIAMPIADPTELDTRMGLVFVGIVASEVAGIALWLGTWRSGERRS